MGFHNVTLYASAGTDFEAMRAFYAAIPGLAVVFEEPGHICCFGGSEVAVCIHEAEGGRPPGARELFFWTDEEEPGEHRLTDPQGNFVRLHRRR